MNGLYALQLSPRFEFADTLLRLSFRKEHGISLTFILLLLIILT
jgi:hypothetical protein